jgi:hypothetical protein
MNTSRVGIWNQQVTIDGACGEQTIERALDLIGMELSKLKTPKGGYIVTMRARP